MKQNPIRAYLRNRPFRNVFLSYFLSMTVISLPILMLFSGVFAYVNQYSIRRESQYYAERDFGVLTYILSNLNTGILRDYGIILSDSNIQRFAEMEYAEVYDMYTHDYGRFTTYNGCLKPMTQVAGNRTYSSICIYLSRSDFVLLWNGFLPRDKFYDSDILQRSIDMRSGSVWLTQTALNYRPMLSFSYDLTINGESYGRVIFNLGVNYLKSLFSEYAGGDYMLTDSSGMILCAQNDSLCGRNIADIPDFTPPETEPVNTVAGELKGDLLRMSYSSGGADAVCHRQSQNLLERPIPACNAAADYGGLRIGVGADIGAGCVDQAIPAGAFSNLGAAARCGGRRMRQAPLFRMAVYPQQHRTHGRS